MDFRKLRDTNILNVCDYLGIELTGRNSPRGECPLCHRQSFTINLKWNHWFCWRCKRNGDGLQLIADVKRISVLQAAKMMVEAFGPR